MHTDILHDLKVKRSWDITVVNLPLGLPRLLGLKNSGKKITIASGKRLITVPRGNPNTVP